MSEMPEIVQVEVARTAERDELLEVLRGRGLDARPVDGDESPGIEIPCGGDAARLCDELLSDLEAWIAEAGLPLVPVRNDGAVLLRPPAP